RADEFPVEAAGSVALHFISRVESHAGSSDKPRNCRASGRLRSAHQLHLPAPRGDVPPLPPSTQAGVDRSLGAPIKCPRASTHGLGSVHRDAQALDRSDRARRRWPASQDLQVILLLWPPRCVETSSGFAAKILSTTLRIRFEKAHAA